MLRGRTDYSISITCYSSLLNIADLEMDSQKDAGNKFSPSILPNQWEMNDVKEFYDERFDFMKDPEWLHVPETKRKRLSLSLNRVRKTEERALVDSTNIVDSTVPTEGSSRFGSLMTEEELVTGAKGICNTHWAEKPGLLNGTEDPVPLDLLKSHDAK